MCVGRKRNPVGPAWAMCNYLEVFRSWNSDKEREDHKMVQHKPDIVPGKPWFSTVTGKYWESREAADHYEREEQMRRTMPADSAFDEFTVPELRTLTEGSMASQALNEPN